MGNLCGSPSDAAEVPKAGLKKEGVISIVTEVEKSLFGFGAFWDNENGKLRYCDIDAAKLVSIDYTIVLVRKVNQKGEIDEKSGNRVKYVTINTGEKPSAFAIDSDNDRFMIAKEMSFELIDEKQSQRSHVFGYKCPDKENEENNLNNKQGGRLNNGRCDRQGRFVCGGYNGLNEDGKTRDKLQKVWQLQSVPVDRRNDGKDQIKTFDNCGVKCEQFFDFKVSCANSICWSPDGKTMYFSDSYDRQILAFDYDIVFGKPSNKRVFYDFEKEQYGGMAYGATVDNKGGIWVAIFGEGKVVRFEPNGAGITHEVIIPKCSHPTSCAIGGKDLDTLFITSHGSHASEEDRKAGGPEENAGCLFQYVLPADFKGIPEPKFKLPWVIQATE